MIICYPYQLEGSELVSYYCEFNDAYVLLSVIFLFLVMILIWKKILW